MEMNIGDLVNMVDPAAHKKFFHGLPPKVKSRVAGLLQLDKQVEALNEECEVEINAVDAKYAELFKPILERRAKIVAGLELPKLDEMERGVAFLEEKAREDLDEEDGELPKVDISLAIDEEAAKKGLPGFWLEVLSSGLDDEVKEHDRPALEHLEDIVVEEEPGKSLRLVFKFSENKWFSNKELVKTLTLTKSDGEIEVDAVEGTTINWKDENLTRVEKKRKQRQGKNVKMVKKSEPRESFFRFFDSAEDDEEDMNKNELDFEIAMELRGMIPHAVELYCGEHDDLSDEEEEEEEEVEEDEDESDEGGKVKKGGAAGQQPQQECKQQ